MKVTDNVKSPAKHNNICCGKDVSPRPSFPRDIFDSYKKKKFRDEEVCAYAAEHKAKLWYLSFNENIFHLLREDVLEIKPDFKDKEEFLQQTIQFYWNFKCQLENTLKAIQNLHTSHKENLKQARYSVS
ncbi:hypothetical protein INT47_003781 [Mucor saturninus]|uniref:Uncharacterized protein n=1 Tax=Mucor saturninus TaxID=64648 RepID=A0A8H7R833_9FUNG|nr:hypothetical protein INT47_003781 [Mucor saturninus]